MKTLVPMIYVIAALFLLLGMAGCSSTGYSPSAAYYRGSAWDYDRYYRSGVNYHYSRPAARANARSEVRSRRGGEGRPGGVRGGGRRR